MILYITFGIRYKSRQFVGRNIPNIPNKEGIDAVLEHVRKDNSAKIPVNRLGKLMELILHQF